MVPIRSYTHLWENMKVYFPQIASVFIVASEKELANHISEASDGDTILLAVIPSSQTFAFNLDNVIEQDTCYVFILKKDSARNTDAADILKNREETQLLVTGIKTKLWKMASDFDSQDASTLIMRRFDMDKLHTDPEYDYMGCNGWSLSFILREKGV